MPPTSKAGKVIVGIIRPKIFKKVLGRYGLKDLDRLNPSFARANGFISTTAFLPMLLSCMGMALASGAAEAVTVYSNPIWIGCFFIFFLSVIRSRERSPYGSGSMAMYIALQQIVTSCSNNTVSPIRVINYILVRKIYWVVQKIFKRKKLLNKMYEPDGNNIYYLQRSDKRIINGIASVNHFPSAFIIVTAIVVGLLFLLYAREISVIVGLPFTHILLAIIVVPIDMMAAGFMVRGWLIYFYYPRIIRRQSGRVVLVDLVSAPMRRESL